MTDESNDLVVFVAQDASGETFARHRFADFLIPNEDDADCTLPDPDSFISTPHSNSFLDLNGDCMPDIFLQKRKNDEELHCIENLRNTNFVY